MTPWLDGAAGTFIVDRRVRELGRIKRASGTRDPVIFRRINRMITQMADEGKLDILRALRDGVLSVRELYDAHRRGEMDTLPTAKAARPLAPAWEAWVVKKDCSAAHKRSLAQSLRHLKAPAPARIADLPDLLERARERLGGRPQSFRLVRAACQAFVKASLKRSHPLYGDVTAVEPLKVRPKRAKHPVTPDEMRELLKALPAPAQEIARTMSRTGMRPNECWGKWTVLPDRVVIHGTKTSGAQRVVPLIGVLERPAMAYKPFLLALREASDSQMTPYDLRRTYANWLEAAGILRTRRKLYLGHGNQDVTDLYEWHEVTKFLAEDAATLRAFLGESHEISHGLRLEASE